MKKYTCFFLLVIAGYFTFSQNNLFFSHHMFTPGFYNPAWVGVDGSGAISLVYRNQWTGYSPTVASGGGAPHSQALLAQVPIKGFPLKGFGLNFSNDNLGAENNVLLNFSTAFSLRIGFGTMLVGVMPGLFNKSLGNNLDFNDPADELNQPSEVQTKFDINAGILYQWDGGAYLGLSSLRINEPKFNNYGSHRRIYVAHGGKNMRINDRFSLSPFLNIRTDLSRMTFDVGSMLDIGDRLWSGLAYRLEEALILYLGYSLLDDRLKAGYSFDYVVENQDAKNPTSHEIFLRYYLPDLMIGGRKKVKTPRFSY